MADADLLDRARAVTPAEPGLRACWTFVIRGLEVGWLDEQTLDELIDALDAGTDLGIEELAFDHLGGELRVSFLDEDARCSPGALRAALAALLGAPALG